MNVISVKFRFALRMLLNIITHPAKILRAAKQLKIWIKDDERSPKSPAVRDIRLWAKKCREIVLSTIHSKMFPGYFKVIESFYKSPITCLKQFSDSIPKGEVILFATVKNDATRIEHFLRHYRGIGVKYFVFLDNDSTDGTVEKIIKHGDCACYQTNVRFEPDVKEGWFNRLAAHYGADNWYIVVDSDELLAYPQMNKLPVGRYVKLAEDCGFSCVKTVMLDLYPNGPLMDASMTDEQYMDNCIYFDNDGYIYDEKCNMVFGGMRTRLFTETGILLTKPTLINFKNTFLITAHSIYPGTADRMSVHAGAVLHYKFLPSDTERYLDFEKTGVHYDGSRYYKDINSKFEKTPEMSAMSDISVKWDDDAWQYLPFVKDLAGVKKRK